MSARASTAPDLTYAHVELRQGVPFITGTETKVVEIARDEVGNGWDAQEIHRNHPYLSLGQIHGALAYYHDHKAEIDADIERRDRVVDELRGRVGEQFSRAVLETRRKKPKESPPASG